MCQSVTDPNIASAEKMVLARRFVESIALVIVGIGNGYQRTLCVVLKRFRNKLAQAIELDG